MTSEKKQFIWTNARIADLERLWQRGDTAAGIGRTLGISKNQVIGKKNRLRLDSRPSPINRSGPQRVPSRTIPKKTAERMLLPAPPTNEIAIKRTRRIGLGGRIRTCQWIEGEIVIDDPTGHNDSCKCGKPVYRDTVYCRAHFERTVPSGLGRPSIA